MATSPELRPQLAEVAFRMRDAGDRAPLHKRRGPRRQTKGGTSISAPCLPCCGVLSTSCSNSTPDLPPTQNPRTLAGHLTPKLSGRTRTRDAQFVDGKSSISTSCGWHLIPHGPLQRKLGARRTAENRPLIDERYGVAEWISSVEHPFSPWHRFNSRGDLTAGVVDSRLHLFEIRCREIKILVGVDPVWWTPHG